MFVLKYSSKNCNYRIVFQKNCQKRSVRFQWNNFRIILFFEARFSMISFGVEQIKVSFFGQRFSAEYQNCIPRTQEEILRLSIFFEKNYNFIILIETWGKNFCLGGRNCKLPVQTIFWGKLKTLKKLFVAK